MTETDEPPEKIETIAQLDELLSRPPDEVVDLFRRLAGPLVVLGGGGKIGPSLVRMACRAKEAAASGRQIIVVDRFPEPAVRDSLAQAGAETIRCDLLDPDAVADLPDARHVVYMVGMKFGTTGRPATTWAVNTLIPAYAARRYRDANVVAFSTGCVYDLVPADSGGSVETDPLEPVGEYSNSCVGRERILEHFSDTCGTAMLLVRLNYAVELRYGVLADIAAAVHAGRPVDLTTGYVNVIWQGDVNAAVLRLLEHTTRPASAINLTGAETLSVRQVAKRLAALMGKEVRFEGTEAETSLLSNASRAHRLLGPPRVPVEQVLRWTAAWVAAGKENLGKPTHFQARDGKY